ncbi:MAG: helix-turn-helix transcriptional regulator [Cyclobacteriaceae bacterium]|nr:helix-turn-helix transcriptional regulator [Cyclobacteriaceae bacterium]
MEPRRDIFQAIADPTRREIINFVARNPQNMNTISSQFDKSRQAISLHVKILQECGVLSITREGRERYCSLQPEKLAEVSDWLEPFREMWEDRFNQLDKVLLKLKSNNHEK